MAETLKSLPSPMNHVKDVAKDSPRVEIRGLTKRFRRRGHKEDIIPIDNVSLEVSGADLVVLLGPSGCGKTTLLRCIAGLERPDEGEIVIDGKTVFSSQKKIFVPPNERHLSMIFQSYALWPHMTVAQNVAYPLKGSAMRGAKAQAAVEEILDVMGLGGLADQHPSRISGGQQQRVALARALVARPKIVLFDEPLSNVDALVRQHLRVELVRMQRELGFCGIYVTHDQEEAMEVGRRIVVLQSGKVVANSSPRAIYERPTSVSVARFIGTANIWPGEVRSVDGPFTRVSCAGPPGDVQARSGPEGHSESQLQPRDEVFVVSRPENFTLSERGTEPISGTANTWNGRIENRLFSGAQTKYVVDVGGYKIQVWQREHSWEEGDSVQVSVKAEALSVLPCDSSGAEVRPSA